MNQQNFPLIKKLGLETIIHFDPAKPSWPIFVNAEDLERALEKATVVYSTKKDFMFDEKAWHEYKYGAQTHSALLINVEELPKEPLKHEYKTSVMEFNDKTGLMKETSLPPEFIGKKICVKIEEIKE